MRRFLLQSGVVAAITVLLAYNGFAQSFWSPVATPSTTSAVTCLAVSSSGAIVAGTSGKGLYLSTNSGTSWTKIDKGAMQQHYYSVAFDDSDHIWAGSYEGLYYVSKDAGATWTSDTVGLSLVTSFSFDKKNKPYIGTGGDGLFSITDTGWASVSANFTNPYVTSSIIDYKGDIVIGTYGGGVYRSTDEGQTWAGEGKTYWRVNSIVAGANHHLFAGTDEGMFYDSLWFDTTAVSPTPQIDTLWSDWVPSGFYLDHIDTTITKVIDSIVVVVGHAPDTVHHLDTNIYKAIYHSRRYATSLAASATGHIYAGTIGHGVFRSIDNGVTWQQSSTGILDSTITAVAIDGNGYLYAATLSGGFYKSANPEPVPPPSSQNGRSVIPVAVNIEQNYPNPFNPTTTIPFTLTRNSYTTLIIYDLLGKEIVRLIDGIVPEGRHEVRWDASSVPSGVYFYRLQSSANVKTGKLTLLK